MTNINSSYYLKEPTIISFSGGRTSAYLLYQVIQAHGGTLPDYVYPVFANTGKEMPQTLDFIKDCEEHWDCKVYWMELSNIVDDTYRKRNVLHTYYQYILLIQLYVFVH